MNYLAFSNAKPMDKMTHQRKNIRGKMAKIVEHKIDIHNAMDY